MAFQIISIEEGDEVPNTTKLTVRVPDASDMDEDFTKLNVQFPYEPEAQGYYIISDRVQVSHLLLLVKDKQPQLLVLRAMTIT